MIIPSSWLYLLNTKDEKTENWTNPYSFWKLNWFWLDLINFIRFFPFTHTLIGIEEKSAHLIFHITFFLFLKFFLSIAYDEIIS